MQHQSLIHNRFPVMFFAISTIFELLCVLLYAFVFPKLSIVKYFHSKAATEGSLTVAADLAVAGVQTSNDQGVIFLQTGFKFRAIPSCLPGFHN